MDIPVKTIHQPDKKKKSNNRRKFTKTFTEALKEKYCLDQDSQTFVGCIIMSPKRKSTVAELAHLKTVVLNEMNLNRAGIPRQGLSSICPNVVDLDLANNDFEHWSELMAILAHLPRVKYVNVSRNGLKLNQNDDLPTSKLSVENLAVNDTGVSIQDMIVLSPLMPELKELHLCDNGYEHLSGIEDGIEKGVFNSLECLRLNDNNIRSWSEVWKLRHLPNLKCLILSGNPVEEIYYEKKTNQATAGSGEDFLTEMDIDQLNDITQELDQSNDTTHECNQSNDNTLKIDQSNESTLDIDQSNDNTLEVDKLFDNTLEMNQPNANTNETNQSNSNRDPLTLSEIEVDVDSEHSEETVEDNDQSFDVTIDSFDSVEDTECSEDDFRPVSRLGSYSDVELDDDGRFSSPVMTMSDNVLHHMTNFGSCYKVEGMRNMNCSNRQIQTPLPCFPYAMDPLAGLSSPESVSDAESEEADDETFRLQAEAFLSIVMDTLGLGSDSDMVTDSAPSVQDVTAIESEHGGRRNEMRSNGIIVSINDGLMVDPLCSDSTDQDQSRTGVPECVDGNLLDHSSQNQPAIVCENLDISDNVSEGVIQNSAEGASVSSSNSCTDCDTNNSSTSPATQKQSEHTLSGPAAHSHGIDRFISSSLQTSHGPAGEEAPSLPDSPQCGARSEKMAQTSSQTPENKTFFCQNDCDTSDNNNSDAQASAKIQIDTAVHSAQPSPSVSGIRSATTVRKLFPTADSDKTESSRRDKLSSTNNMDVEIPSQNVHDPQSSTNLEKSITEQSLGVEADQSLINYCNNQIMDESSNAPNMTESSATLPPFHQLEMLCLSNAGLNHWSHLKALKEFPKLVNVRISNNPLYGSVGAEDRRKLYIACLPNVTILNGSEVTPMEREKAERFYLRHFMKAEEKPGFYDQLVKKHGQPVELVDINIGQGYQEYATLDFVYEGNVLFSKRLFLRDPVGKLRLLIASEMGIPKNSFTMYHYSCGPLHPESERELMELRCESLPMSRFDFSDGDQIQIDFSQ